MARALYLFWSLTVTVLALGQSSSQRKADLYLTSVAATSDGGTLFFDVMRDDLTSHMLVAVSTRFGRVAWQYSSAHIPTVLAVSPDNQTIASGFSHVNDSGDGVVLLDVATGKQVGGLGTNDTLDFEPGVGYPTWGDGIEGLAFSPDQTLLYGLSDDTLFAWNLHAKKYLWVKDVPAAYILPRAMTAFSDDAHSTALALAPSGKQIVAARTVLWDTSAGRNRPTHFIKRGSPQLDIVSPGRPTFSSDSQVLAAGEVLPLGGGKGNSYALEYWLGSNPKGTRIPGCGGGIAWTNQPDVFGCQDDSGAHLRNIHDAAKNIGAAGPPSDLPILKVGNSLWSVAYKNDDWKDGTKPLPLTLIELGTGKHVTITLPGRPTISPASH